MIKLMYCKLPILANKQLGGSSILIFKIVVSCRYNCLCSFEFKEKTEFKFSETVILYEAHGLEPLSIPIINRDALN